MKFRISRAAGLAAVLAATAAVRAVDPIPQWPQFRGPNGAGVSEGDAPVVFGPGTNTLWQTPLSSGHSSPCIWEDRIFLTAFSDGQLQTVCIRRGDGHTLWTRSLPPGAIERGSRLSHPAAATPATDGRNVYVYFGAFGLAAYDFDGREQWRHPLPPPVTQHGASSSPVLANGILVQACDQDLDSYLLALDASTGALCWKTARPGFRRGFSTPLLWPADKPQFAVLPGTLRVVAYNLGDGAEAWSIRGLPNEMVTTPAAGEGLIFVAGWTPGSGVSRMPGFESLLERSDSDGDGRLSRQEAPSGPARQHFHYIDADKDGFLTKAEWTTIADIFDNSENALIAFRPNGKGDITEQAVVWKETRGLPYVPSPLYYEGNVYLVKNGGLASCFDAKSGAAHYEQERLGAIGDYYASPVAASRKIYAASQPGTVVVFAAGPELRVLARNSVGEEIFATPAIADSVLYIRTAAHLFAFGAPPAKKSD